MLVLHQSKFISKGGPLSFIQVWAEYKDKEPDSHQNIGTSCNSKLKLTKFKDLFIKITENLLKYEWMYVSTYQMSNYDILIPVLNTFTFETEEYCLDDNYMVNDAKAMRGKGVSSRSVKKVAWFFKQQTEFFLISCLAVA